LMKMVSLAHRRGPTGYSEAYFLSDLGDLVAQTSLLCQDHGKTLEAMERAGFARFQERVELKENW